MKIRWNSLIIIIGSDVNQSKTKDKNVYMTLNLSGQYFFLHGSACQTVLEQAGMWAPLMLCLIRRVQWTQRQRPIYFHKSLDVTRPYTHRHWLCRMDHQHLKQWSTFCLSSWPLPITQHKRWKVAAAPRTGHAEGSRGSGDWYGAHFASPLAVCPQPSWPLDNEPFSALQRATQPFNPRPDLVSGGGGEEARGAPHVSPLETVIMSMLSPHMIQALLFIFTAIVFILLLWPPT